MFIGARGSGTRVKDETKIGHPNKTHSCRSVKDALSYRPFFLETYKIKNSEYSAHFVSFSAAAKRINDMINLY